MSQRPVIKHTGSELTSNLGGCKYQFDLPVDNSKAEHMEMEVGKRRYNKEKKKGGEERYEALKYPRFLAS